MKRTFLIPLLSALIGGGLVVAVVAAAGDLGSSSEDGHDRAAGLYTACAFQRFAAEHRVDAASDI